MDDDLCTISAIIACITMQLSFAAIILLFSSQAALGQKCGYDSCPATQPGKLNVHILCHSHDDVGWLKTVDQYYYGSARKRWPVGDTENQRAGVQYIIDSVVKELAFDPKKRFIQVETAFFWRWWNEQNEVMQDLVKDLVAEGQLEFIGGGWSMNDEAAAHYHSIIDQMTLGLVKLNHTFPDGCGVPRVAWQIDPFGHSREQASLFAQLGFDGLFFGRLDWRDKATRMANKTMEMVWHSGYYEEDDLFTGVLYNYYFPPPNFCWDLLCNDEPIMDNPELHDYNLDRIVSEFIDYAKEAARPYRTNHVAITTGMDFHYQAAHAWFINLDKLIKHANSLIENNVHIMYSTPSCYLKALKEANQAWPIKTDDFFPYASDPHAYWTGYYSSRPTSKRMIREAANYLQAAKQITAKNHFNANCDESCLFYQLKATEALDRAVGVAQHHDAITGTEQDVVAADYHRRLDISKYLWSYEAFGLQSHCKYLNISVCDISGTWETQVPNDSEFELYAYNPLGRSSYEPIVRFPIPSENWMAIDKETGATLESQVVAIPEAVINLPGRGSQNHLTYEIFFQASHIRAISQASFSIKPTNEILDQKMLYLIQDDQIFTTNAGSYFYDSSKKQVTSFTDNFGTVYNFSQEFMYYIGHRGNNSEFDFRASGAYIFRPESQEPVKLGLPLSVSVQEGALFIEFHMEFESYVSQILRIYKDSDHGLVEIEWIIGPIPIEDGNGKEFIHKLTMTDWSNSQLFYTDANGRQNVKRRRNWRPDYDLANATSEEPVASNYYPINAWISMEDTKSNRWVSILTDRSSGAASISDDSIEVMVHRRLLDDDAFGVQQPLNETEFGKGIVARGKHLITFEGSKSANIRTVRQIANTLFSSPIVTMNNRAGTGNYVVPTSAASVELPINVNLLTLAVIPETKQVLIRIEHLFAPEEDPIFSAPVTVSLSGLLSNEGYGLGRVTAVKETTLGANQWKDQVDRLQWTSEDSTKNRPKKEKYSIEAPEFEITLNPFEIRSFIITIEKY